MIFILTAICAVSAGVLASVESITRDKIARVKTEEETRVMKEMFVDASNFIDEDTGAAQNNIQWIKKAVDAGGSVIGWCVCASSRGYSSDITLIAAVTPQKTVKDLRIVSQNETPGLGTKVCGRDFWGQFVGKSGPDIEAPGGVHTITGATISSKALKKAVIAALSSVR